MSRDCGRNDGYGYKKRNPKVRMPEDKVIWNHYRMSEDQGKFTSSPYSWEDYRRGFLDNFITGKKNGHARHRRPLSRRPEKDQAA